MANEAAAKAVREMPGRDAIVRDAASPRVAPPANGDAPEAAPAGEADDLLACLEFLTRFYQRPYSAAVLKAGLPLAAGALTPTLFVRAAERAGLIARAVRRTLDGLSNVELPVVAVLGGDRACVILERQADVRGRDATFTIMLPEAGGGVQQVSVSDLAARHAGYVLYARPAYHFDKGDEGERREPRAWFWSVVASNWTTYAQVALAAILVNVFALAMPLFTMAVYDRVVPNNALDTLWVLSVGIVLVLGFDFVVKALRGYYIDVAGRRADVTLASRIFDHVLDIQLAARPASAGGFANTLREFETVQDFFTSATVATVIDVPFIALFVAMIWLVGGPLAVVPLAAVPAVLFAGLLIQWPLNRAIRSAFGQAESKHGVLFETIGGLETIKSVGADARMRHLWETSVGRAARASVRAKTMAQLAMNFTAFVAQFASVAILVYGVVLIADGVMSVGALIACVMLNGRAVGSLGQLAQLLVRWHQARVSLRALDAVMRMPTEHPRDRRFLHRPSLKGRVELRAVTFAYPGAVTPALNEASFTVTEGERVGIVGRVGSGKSTVQKLVLGLYTPQNGSVLVDGTELRQIDPADLRRAIGVVPQDVFLFRGSVRENISVGAPHATDAQILNAAKLGGVDEFVAAHPLGYDLPVGERGEGLSGGQRQAIALARAFLHDPAILLLDEPTNSMDNAAEIALRRNLEQHLEGRTLLLVTHRTSLLSLVNRLIVLDKGRVVADGPKQAVLDAIAQGRVAMIAE
jgi:ATP-binding cassette subfamily C protein LapB